MGDLGSFRCYGLFYHTYIGALRPQFFLFSWKNSKNIDVLLMKIV